MPQPLSVISTITSLPLARVRIDDPAVFPVGLLDRLHGVDQQVQEDLVDLHRGGRDQGELSLVLLER